MRHFLFIVLMLFSTMCFGSGGVSAPLSITNVNQIVKSATQVNHICRFVETVPTQPVLQRHIITTSDKKFKINVVTAGNPKGQPLLFVHGSPGNWKIWEKYLLNPALSKKYYLIAYDRPGYGETTPKGVTTARLDEQANIASDILHVLAKGRPAALIAHSYGGAVAVKYAVMHSNEVKSLMLLAPALNPNTEDHFYYRIANSAAFQAISGFINHEEIAASARESVPLPDELRKLTAGLPRILNTPISIYQGKADNIVDPKTPSYFQHLMGSKSKTSVHYIDGQSHHIPTDLPVFVTSRILQLF